ncbi:hypothetical protein M0R89_01230 [Halorussus limi]|uniref:Uncharacterized protein n=1 Tax=Halorussus limi TaxID=2938695 RepID=A0A8U0HUV2_9EURY|nr:hypothetical protein [Halorussus limi]UPV74708.1 hypothetical protein M0R89_01230 [Halorussus limi]
MDSPRRRALLGAVGLAAVGTGAGCLRTDTRESETTTRPTAGRTTSATTDETEARPAVTDETDRTTGKRKRTDDLFLTNRLSDDRLLDLRVTRRTNGSDERLLSRRYEVPAGSALELSNLVVAGNTYDVETRLPGGEWRAFAWAVTDCSEYGTPTQEPRTPEDDPTLNTDAMAGCATLASSFSATSATASRSRGTPPLQPASTSCGTTSPRRSPVEVQ